MSYRTHCDWCGEYLAPEDDQAVMPVTIQHRRGNGTLDAKWAEETKPTRHFCASPREERDRNGRNRMGIMAGDSASDSCYDRALAAIRGTESTTPDMGMEWRLVEVGNQKDRERVTKKLDAERLACAYWLAGVNRLGSRAMRSLVDAYVDADRAADMTDEELLALDGVGPGAVRAIREALAPVAVDA